MEALTLAPDQPLALGLAAQRERFNSLFLQARRVNPQLDGPQFLQLLVRHVSPVLNTVCALAPQSRDVLLDVLYRAMLQLASSNGTREDAFLTSWSSLLAAVPRYLLESPQTVVSAAANALHTLHSTPQADSQRWVQRMQRLGQNAYPVEQFLSAGQVIAWMCGLAHFRESALSVCRSLPEPLVHELLEITADPERIPLASILDRITEDPWLMPSSIKDPGQQDLFQRFRTAPSRVLQIVGVVGGFSGFGGPFDRPAQLFSTDGRLYARYGDQCWAILADAFGGGCYRCPVPPSVAWVPASPFVLNPSGEVRYGDLRGQFPILQNARSSAGNRHTLAVARDCSFRIYLVAACEAA